jgi:tetratricopeptide (TPR) repeat protein
MFWGIIDKGKLLIYKNYRGKNMNKLRVFFIVLIIVLLNISCQQKKDNTDYKGMYEIFMGNQEYDQLYKHLQKWEKKEPYNPEMFIAFFNYYAFKDSPQDNNADILKAVDYLDRGLSIAPNRLDMRFGKIYTLTDNKYYIEAGNELYTTLEMSKKINNDWLWADNGKVEDGEAYFLNGISRYYDSWLGAQTEESLEQTKRCAEKQIELYPETRTSPYFNLAVYYSIKEQDQVSLQYLFQAETVNPNDCLILANIGRTYTAMNDKEKAREYLTRALQVAQTEYETQVVEYSLQQLNSSD